MEEKEILEEDVEEAREVLGCLDKKRQLGNELTETLVHIMAPYYAKKRIHKQPPDGRGLFDEFERMSEKIREIVPIQLQREIFSL